MNDMKKLKKYSVVIEANVPALLFYEILAESPEEAEQLIKTKSPTKIEYKIKKKKSIFIKIYEFGTCMLHKSKSLL